MQVTRQQEAGLGLEVEGTWCWGAHRGTINLQGSLGGVPSQSILHPGHAYREAAMPSDAPSGTVAGRTWAPAVLLMTAVSLWVWEFGNGWDPIPGESEVLGHWRV